MASVGDVNEILDLLSRAQQRGELRFLVIGGRGLEAHGIQRFTNDTDVLLAAAQMDKVGEVLRGGGFESLSESPNFTRWRHRDPMIEILDVMRVNEGTFEKLWADSILFQAGGATLRAPSVRSYIALKIFAIQNNPDRFMKDMGDIASLFKGAQGKITVDDLRATCERYGTPELLARMMVSLGL